MKLKLALPYNVYINGKLHSVQHRSEYTYTDILETVVRQGNTLVYEYKVLPKFHVNIMTKAGSCRSGGDLGGVVQHAIALSGDYSMNPALCGNSPQGRSAGWSSWTSKHEVTCPKCLKALAHLMTLGLVSGIYSYQSPENKN